MGEYAADGRAGRKRRAAIGEQASGHRVDIGAPVTREVLYIEVWAEPITAVAARYVASGSFIAQLCTRLKCPATPTGTCAALP